MARIHYGRFFNVRGWESVGLVYPLDRSEYYRDIFDWVFEDEIEEEGIFLVSHRVTGAFRYVVMYRFPVYRALIPSTGEILESNSMKAIYKRALFHAKFELYDNPEMLVCTIEFEKAFYSDREYLNSLGYMQRDLEERQHIAYLAVSATGYTIDTADGTIDVKRG